MWCNRPARLWDTYVLSTACTVLLLIQLPVNGPQKLGDHGPSSWGPANHMGDLDRDPSLRLQPSRCGYLGSEPEDKLEIYLSTQHLTPSFLQIST